MRSFMNIKSSRKFPNLQYTCDSVTGFFGFAASSTWDSLVTKDKVPPNVSRYFNFLSAQPIFRTVQDQFPRSKALPKQDKKAETSVS